MARTSTGPRFFASKNAYFGTLAGERIRLCDGPQSPEKDLEARRLYDACILGRRVHSDRDEAETWAVLNAWLHHCWTRTDPPPVAVTTLDDYKRYLQSFVDAYGLLPWKDITQEHVSVWLAARGGSRDAAERTLRAACAWASAAGNLVEHNPMAQGPADAGAAGTSPAEQA